MSDVRYMLVRDDLELVRKLLVRAACELAMAGTDEAVSLSDRVGSLLGDITKNHTGLLAICDELDELMAS